MSLPKFRKRYVLMLVEGDTEVMFYELVKEKFFRGARSKIINLNGNWAIEKKVLDEVSRHAEAHPETQFSVQICIDRESRAGKAPIDLDVVKKELSSYSNVKSDGIHLREAIQDIECWFFNDISGIFKFLRIPTHERDEGKFRPVEKLSHRNMSELFERYGRDYRKGNASKNFLNALDLDKIQSSAVPLRDLCVFMKSYIP